mgnify:FL=1
MTMSQQVSAGPMSVEPVPLVAGVFLPDAERWAKTAEKLPRGFYNYLEWSII